MLERVRKNLRTQRGVTRRDETETIVGSHVSSVAVVSDSRRQWLRGVQCAVCVLVCLAEGVHGCVQLGVCV